MRPPAKGGDPLGERIATMCDAVGTREAAARAAGIGPRQLLKIIRGDAKPTAEALARLADASGYSLDWVMTGRGAPKRTGAATGGTDPELMGRLLDGLSKVYSEEGATLPPVELGRICAQEHDAIARATGDPAERTTMVKLVLEKHRHALKTESPARRQHGA